MVGDYLFQTDWQARHKRGGLSGDRVALRALCTHVATYTLAFLPAFVWIADELDAGWAVLAAVLIALPQPFPAVADLRILCGADKSAYLEIRVLRAPYDSLRYTVHVDDVRAICYAKDKQPPTRIDRSNLDYGDGVARRVKEDQPGIVFVRDNASLLRPRRLCRACQSVCSR